MIWWRWIWPREQNRTEKIKAFLDRIVETTFLAIGIHSAILFDSLCTQGFQQLNNENPVSNLSVEIDKLKNMSRKRAGRDPGSAVSPYIRAILLFNTTMLCKGKKKLIAVMTIDENLIFAFQNCRVKFFRELCIESSILLL